MNADAVNRLSRASLAAAVLIGAAGLCPVPAACAAMPASHIQARALADEGGKDKKDSKKDDAPQGDPIDIDKLPKAVVNGLKKAMPGARIVKAAKLPDGNYFLDDVKVGKKEYDVTISPEGKILKSVEQQGD